MEDVFNSLDFLEPKCPKCNSKIEYCVTTEFNEELGKHICKNCGYELN